MLRKIYFLNFELTFGKFMKILKKIYEDFALNFAEITKRIQGNFEKIMFGKVSRKF